MSARSANVNVRLDPAIKEQGAAILRVLGVSESTFIDMAYRQLVLTRGIPFPVTLPQVPRSLDTMTPEQFNAILASGIQQAKSGEGQPADETFRDILAGL